MKRFFAIVLAIVMCVGLAACGNAAQKAASQVTTTAEAATEQLTEETTEKETTAETTEQIETVETTAQTVETQAEEFKITDGYFYEGSPQTTTLTEWHFNEDGTCSSKDRTPDVGDFVMQDGETEYHTYSIDGSNILINKEERNGEIRTTKWEFVPEDECCYYYFSYYNPDGTFTGDYRLTIFHSDYMLSKNEINSMEHSYVTKLS